MSQDYPISTEPAELSGDYDLPTPLGDTVGEAAEAYFGEGFKLIAADVLYDNLNDGDTDNDPTIIDIRSADDYALGHIEGAVNVGGKALFNSDTLATIPEDQQVVLVCYSGQTAGQAAAAFNMLGYDAYSLKSGMPAWALVEGVSKGTWQDSMSQDYPVVGDTAGSTTEPSTTPPTTLPDTGVVTGWIALPAVVGVAALLAGLFLRRRSRS
jgi:LPXTG-motif cell wall-anchored protein